jgi:hypothetical protein
LPQRLFYSWQSDVKQNRGFIRSALDNAVEEVARDTSIDDAQRDIAVDQDTQGLPGSPSVADAILQKIRSADFFVADLTFVSEGGSRRIPNPNVLLEYGYALHAIGDSRIITVLNDANGGPNDLPFDLVHRRWPIRFTLPPDATPERASVKLRLTKSLAEAIKSVLSQFGSIKAGAEAALTYTPIEPGDGIGRLRGPQDYLCMPDAGDPIYLSSGPYAFFRCIPTQPPRILGTVEANRIVQHLLQPMTGARAGGGITCRHSTGSVTYWAVGTAQQVAVDASELFLSGEIWGNSAYLLNTAVRPKEVTFPFLATGSFEEVLIDTLVNYVAVAKDVKLALPLQLKMGIVGVGDYRLAVDRQYFHYDEYAGRILNNTVLYDTILSDWSADPFELLKPFFEEVYDKAGISRPDVRAVGRRQR